MYSFPAIAANLVTLLGYDGYYAFTCEDGFGRAMANGRNHGLSDEEAAAVFLYTVDSINGISPFRVVNDMLRDNNRPLLRRYAPLLTAMRNGIGKLPRYRGWVRRRIHVDARTMAELEAMTAYRETAFMSASKETADAFKGNVMLMILSVSGRDIELLSAFPEEKEVIFLPGTGFLLEELTKGAKTTVLFLNETT